MKALPASLTGALAAAATVTGEYRALTLYDAAPHDCGAVLVGELIGFLMMPKTVTLSYS